MSIAVHVQYARIVTPAVTYVKYTLYIDPNGEAIVKEPRGDKVMRALWDVEAREHPDAFARYQIVGTNVDGAREVWRVDNMGCGCRDSTRSEPTTPAELERLTVA